LIIMEGGFCLAVKVGFSRHYLFLIRVWYNGVVWIL
jgi:hypothetical protein